MKTIIALAALALVSSVAAARSVDTSTRGDRSDFKIVATGDGPDIRYFAPSQRSRAEVIAERDGALRLPSYVDGSEYENAFAMFMSTQTREQVRAAAAMAARISADNYEALARMGGAH